MKFARTQKLFLFAAAMFSALPLLYSSEVGIGARIAFAAAWIAGWFISPPFAARPVYRRSITIVLSGVLLLQATRVLAGTPMAMGAMELAAALLAAKLISRAGATDDYQIALLSFLHLIAGTAAMDQLLFGICFLGFTACAPPALAMIHLRNEMEGRFGPNSKHRDGGLALKRLFDSKRIVTPRFVLGASLLSVPVLVLTVLLFVLFPRFGFGFLGRLSRPDRVVGFGDTVSLDDADRPDQGEEVIIRVEPLPMPDAPPRRIPLRLRTAVMEHFDGRVWKRDETPAWRPMPFDASGFHFARRAERPPFDADTPVMDLLADAMSPPLLPVPEGCGWIAPDSAADRRHGFRIRSLSINRVGEVQFEDAAETGIRYRAGITGRPPPGPPPTRNGDTLRLYPGAERVKRTATEVAGSGTDAEKAGRLVRMLRQNYRYALTPTAPKNPAAGERGVERFLYRERTGNCEHFATALTLLLRAAGIPARLVTGFLGADLNPVGDFYAVRRRYAHAWTEAFIDGRWVTLDATPSGPSTAFSRPPAFWALLLETLQMRWRKHVVGYDAAAQGKLAMGAWHRMRAFRQKTSFDSSAARPIALAAIGAVLVIGVAIRLRSRRQFGLRKGHGEGSQPSSAAGTAALGRALERRFSKLGAPKPSHLTWFEHLEPLKHTPRFSWHEADALIRRYQELRFGNRPIGPGEHRALKRRIRMLGRG